MHVNSVRIATALAASLLVATPQAYGGECLPTGLASYSNLGRAMAKIRDGASGELLAIWLLESPNASECRFAFRIDRLQPGGSITSMAFDAQTLEEVSVDDSRGWAEYGGGGQGSEASSSGRGGGASGENSESESSNSGKGSSNSGSDDDGDDGDDGDSSGSGSDGDGGGDDGGDDSGGSGSSGSGSGGSDD